MNLGRRWRTLFRILMVGAVGIAVLLVSAFLVASRPFAEPPWVEASPNSLAIYRNVASSRVDRAQVPVVSPFHLAHDPMTGLLLINFEQDPDVVYHGLEPQSFDDAVHGRGILVIGWRVDGLVDVYYQTGLRLNPDTYGIAGKGLNAMVERPFSDALFELGPRGAQADIRFEDLDGRPVHIVVHETDTRPRTSFGLLAPMGVAASDPPALPLVYVDQFSFVRRAGTELRIEIDGRSHQSDFLPFILDGTPVHFLRYSAAPFVITWNPDVAARVRTLDPRVEAGAGVHGAHADGVRYELEANDGFLEIRRMSRREGEHEVMIEFTPAIPHLLALADAAAANGAFRVSAEPGLGTVRGSWHVTRNGSELNMELRPDGGWTPGPGPRMARLLFRAISMFRQWPTTYLWRGTIQLPAPDAPRDSPLAFHSGWERIEH